MPEVVVLGVAQDGGVPHAGCLCLNCRAARSDPGRHHLPVSLGLVSGDRFAMVDATSGFEAQHAMLWNHSSAACEWEAERFPAPESIVLTHAHTGHYTGLWQLDRSVLAASGTRVLGPPRTMQLLLDNEPWQAMQREGFIAMEQVGFNRPFELMPKIRMELLEVPHRSEWGTDTAALTLAGPQRKMLYLPDIDFWDAWDRDVLATVREYDIALLDGCFWVAPPRKGVPHPPVTETMDRLQEIAGDVEIVFTHFNHSNPVLTQGSPERSTVEERGFRIAREGDVFSI